MNEELSLPFEELSETLEKAFDKKPNQDPLNNRPQNQPQNQPLNQNPSQPSTTNILPSKSLENGANLALQTSNQSVEKCVILPTNELADPFSLVYAYRLDKRAVQWGDLSLFKVKG